MGVSTIGCSRRSICRCSNLRIFRGSENEVGNVADDRLKVELLRGRQLFPLRIAKERCPHIVQFLEVAEADHVGEAGKARADERIAEEHPPEAAPLKDVKLSLVEHANFA